MCGHVGGLGLSCGREDRESTLRERGRHLGGETHTCRRERGCG